MQMLGIHNARFYRNRLTHSLEVCQISNGIITHLRKASNTLYSNEDSYVVQSASLAHDIGNPPFGHFGERHLNELAADFGGFESNAQTFRILHRLEKKIPNESGLNLTKRTLLSIVKYFKKHNEDSKKFLYDDDFDLVESIANEKDIKFKTLDAQVMDIADEIAYAAHDLEDALSLKLFNIDDILFEFGLEENEPNLLKRYGYSKDEIQSSCKELKKIIKNCKDIAEQSSTYKSSEGYDYIFRKELTSNIVNKLINDIGLVKIEEDPKYFHEKELGFVKHIALSKGLKEITFNCINRSDVIKIYEKKGRMILTKLFKVYSDKDFNPNNYLLPVEYQKNSGNKNRSIIDYLSGMMDFFAVEQFEKLYGKDSSDKIYINKSK